MSETKHTPIPWELTFSDSMMEGEDAWLIVSHDQDGSDIAEVTSPRDTAEGNARLIVRAVNSHADLLEELKSLVSKIEDAGWHKSETESAREIIARAEGK